jgi:orotidine-5'-phosphate decarboxylase
MKANKVIVALYTSNIKKVKEIVQKLKSEVYAFKIGYEFFLNHGIKVYNTVRKICPRIFLDLKLHDIPNTTKKGIEAINKLKPLLTTIHISGGDEMMKASLINRKHTKILGVSILTSLDNTQTKKYYNEKKIENLVKKFVKQAQKNKLDGVICSPKEIKYIRKEVGKNFLIITPGIRINNSNKIKDDQKRVLTPAEAISLGANFLVIGRPILQSKNPLNTIREINRTIN